MFDDPRDPSERPGAFFYDNMGRMIGSDIPDGFGGATRFDANGGYAGYSIPGLAGEMHHYDATGNYTGYSTPGPVGSDNLYTADGQYVGYTIPTGFGSMAVPDPLGASDDFLRRDFFGNADAGAPDFGDMPFGFDE